LQLRTETRQGAKGCREGSNEISSCIKEGNFLFEGLLVSSYVRTLFHGTNWLIIFHTLLFSLSCLSVSLSVFRGPYSTLSFWILCCFLQRFFLSFRCLVFMLSTQDTGYMIPELTSFEEWLKRKCLDTTITWTANLNNFLPYFNCILTTVLILRIVTLILCNSNFNNVQNSYHVSWSKICTC
jgi:hypothetical protein